MAHQVKVGSHSYGMIGKRAVVRATHIACLCEGCQGASEPVEWEE